MELFVTIIVTTILSLSSADFMTKSLIRHNTSRSVTNEDSNHDNYMSQVVSWSLESVKAGRVKQVEYFVRISN